MIVVVVVKNKRTIFAFLHYQLIAKKTPERLISSFEPETGNFFEIVQKKKSLWGFPLFPSPRMPAS